MNFVPKKLQKSPNKKQHPFHLICSNASAQGTKCIVDVFWLEKLVNSAQPAIEELGERTLLDFMS